METKIDIQQLEKIINQAIDLLEVGCEFFSCRAYEASIKFTYSEDKYTNLYSNFLSHKFPDFDNKGTSFNCLFYFYPKEQEEFQKDTLKFRINMLIECLEYYRKLDNLN